MGQWVHRFAHCENPWGHRKAAVHLAGLGSCKGTAWGARLRARLRKATDPYRSHRGPPQKTFSFTTSKWLKLNWFCDRMFCDALICFDCYCIWYREIISEAMLNSLASLDAKHPVMFVPFGWPTVMNGLPAFLFRLSKNFSDPPKASKIWHGALAPWPLLANGNQATGYWNPMKSSNPGPLKFECTRFERRNKKNKKTCFQRPLIKS